MANATKTTSILLVCLLKKPRVLKLFPPRIREGASVIDAKNSVKYSCSRRSNQRIHIYERTSIHALIQSCAPHLARRYWSTTKVCRRTFAARAAEGACLCASCPNEAASHASCSTLCVTRPSGGATRKAEARYGSCWYSIRDESRS